MSDAPEMRSDRIDQGTPVEQDMPDRGIQNRDVQDRDMRDRVARERDDERMGMERPVPRMAREPVTTRDTSVTPSDGTDPNMWPDMGDLRQRFDAVQSEFIEDPKGAVGKAEELVREVVDRLTRSMNDRMTTMHRGVEKTNDTEQLRQTMRGFRELVDWMENRRAA